MYQFSKLTDENETFSKPARLKKLIDEIIFPTFKLEALKFFEGNGQNIQIFYDKFKVYSNPTVLLFCECDDLMKHVSLFF